MTTKYKLDRTAFHMGTHTETEQYHASQQAETYAERLKQANYLISVAFDFDLSNPPRLNKSAFSARKHQ